MDASFIPVEVVPSQTPFGLDQLRRSYKTPLSAADALLACPLIGTSDETFPWMFLMPVNTPESAESATRVDLLYMGTLRELDGGPWLPDQKHGLGTSVQSTSSSKASSGIAVTSPMTLQYYAPQSTLTYFTFGATGTTEAPEPPGIPVIITLTCGDATFSPTSLPSVVSTFFTPQIISTIESTEIVPGQYWQNVARKTKGYSPWIFNIVSGPYLSLYSPGINYTAGDTLTISSGGESATIVVDSVGAVWGSGNGVWSFHATANTFTASHNSLMASGGTGSGAGFNVFIIP